MKSRPIPFGNAREITMSQRVDGNEVVRITGELSAASAGEILHAMPAARVRELPEVNVEVRLTAHGHDGEREIGTYTLIHGGSLHRRR